MSGGIYEPDDRPHPDRIAQLKAENAALKSDVNLYKDVGEARGMEIVRLTRELVEATKHNQQLVNNDIAYRKIYHELEAENASLEQFKEWAEAQLEADREHFNQQNEIISNQAARLADKEMLAAELGRLREQLAAKERELEIAVSQIRT